MADLMNITNPLSSLSYTNKDFVDIYTELLNLAKTISSKWDPTISNESDPGVVLLKINAIIADKNNYNIDKSILETFPGTVAQENNARHLFEQLGYKMKWYQSAETTISLKFLDATGNVPAQTPDEQLPYINIPIFTEFTDVDNTVIYTSIESARIIYSKEAKTVKALEGSINNYTINNRDVITLSDIDEYNRIYFDDVNIAENGVFIADYSGNDTDLHWVYDGKTTGWVAVDNLYTVENSPNRLEKHFKIGVLPISNTVYIEFPDNVSELIGKGVKIKYITTRGNNVATLKGDITKFNSKAPLSVNSGSNFNSAWFPTVMKDGEGLKSTIEANGGLISVYNITASQGGSEPQSIDEAYTGYQKTIGTFNTLVTLRDYINAINTICVKNKHVSNGFVTDRTDDIDDSISVVDTEADYYRTKNYVLGVKNGDNFIGNLSAFDLRLYLLQYSGNPNISTEEYLTTFNIITNEDEIELVKEDLDETKSIQHDFKDIDKNKLLFIKNKYPLAFKVYTSNAVDLASIVTIKVNIEVALRNNLNSQKVKFGEEINYDYVYETILNSDSRIKQVLLEDIQYTSYGIYLDNNGVQQEVKLNNFTTGETIDPKAIDFIKEIYAKSVLNGNTTLFKQISPFNYRLDAEGYQIDNITKITTSTSMTIPSQSEATINKNDNVIFYTDNLNEVTNYSNYMYYFWKPSIAPYQAYPSNARIDDSNKFFTYINNVLISNYVYLMGESNTLVFTFTYDDSNWNTSYTLSGIGNPIDFGDPISNADLLTKTGCSYIGTPVNNSNFTITVSKTTSQGIQTIIADSAKKIEAGDSITFIWRNSDDDVMYNYRVYVHGEDKDVYFKPSFNMTSNVPSSEISTKIDSWMNSTYKEGTIPVSEVTNWKLTNTNRLTSSSNISIMEPNTVKINNFAEFTIISNTSENKPNTAKDCYKLTFVPDETNTTDNSRYYYCILQDDEYLCYINGAKTELAALGSGTKIQLKIDGYTDNNNISLYVPIKSNETQTSIVSYGLEAVNNYVWLPTNITFDDNTNNYMFNFNNRPINGELSVLEGVEQEIIILGEGYTIGNRSNNAVKLSSIEATKVNINNQLYYRNLSNMAQSITPLAQDSRTWYATMHMNLVSSNVIEQELREGQFLKIESKDSSDPYIFGKGSTGKLIIESCGYNSTPLTDPNIQIIDVDYEKMSVSLGIKTDTIVELLIRTVDPVYCLTWGTNEIYTNNINNYGITLDSTDLNNGSLGTISLDFEELNFDAFLTNIQLSESSSETNIDNRWWYNKGLLVQPKYGLQMYYWKKIDFDDGYTGVKLPSGNYLFKVNKKISLSVDNAPMSKFIEIDNYSYYKEEIENSSNLNIVCDKELSDYHVIMFDDNVNFSRPITTHNKNVIAFPYIPNTTAHITINYSDTVSESIGKYYIKYDGQNWTDLSGETSVTLLDYGIESVVGAVNGTCIQIVIYRTINTDVILFKILELLQNINNATFDFTYQTLSENEITYPTEPLSFLDSRHWYNKFTICQLNNNYNNTYKTQVLDIPDNPVITIRR